MKVSDADRVFGCCIADISAAVEPRPDVDRLGWMCHTAARTAGPESCSELLGELRVILAPVLTGAGEPDDRTRLRCTEAI